MSGTLDPNEEERLLQAATEPLKSIIIKGLDAGLRIKAEALTLKKEDVDLEHNLLYIRALNAKSGEQGVVPINSRLKEALERQIKRSKSDYVFVKSNRKTPFKSIRTRFATVCRNAKLVGVTPHVLRHTFASRLAMAGCDLRTIQELGRWKSLKMVERYAHLSPSHKADAVEKILAISQHYSQRSDSEESSPILQVVSNQ